MFFLVQSCGNARIEKGKKNRGNLDFTTPKSPENPT
jgi:hypothetical protein